MYIASPFEQCCKGGGGDQPQELAHGGSRDRFTVSLFQQDVAILWHRVYSINHGGNGGVVHTVRFHMPNWMTSEVQITGPCDEIARFRSVHICSDEAGEDRLDFNSIIPMPPELRGTESGGYIDVLVWALGGELYAERNLWRKLGMHAAADTPIGRPWLRDAGITTRQELLLWAEKEHPDQLDAARRTREVERATGYRNWYDWQLENWGCKWGCCGFMWLSDDKTAFYMDTPWSAPSPVFEKLVELYPSLTFTCHFVEAGNDIDYVETYTA